MVLWEQLTRVSLGEAFSRVDISALVHLSVQAPTEDCAPFCPRTVTGSLSENRGARSWGDSLCGSPGLSLMLCWGLWALLLSSCLWQARQKCEAVLGTGHLWGRGEQAESAGMTLRTSGHLL